MFHKEALESRASERNGWARRAAKQLAVPAILPRRDGR